LLNRSHFTHSLIVLPARSMRVLGRFCLERLMDTALLIFVFINYPFALSLAKRI
jgi:hypothetical protein